MWFSMSSITVRKIGFVAKETAVEAVWAQWTALSPTPIASDYRQLWTIVDPEALILVSLGLRQFEWRLDDLLIGWAQVGASFTSIQRLNTLARSYPESVRNQIAGFAARATAAGHRQWSRLAGAPGRVTQVSRQKTFGNLRFTEGPALMLRLRAGIGLGAKADLLTFLLGNAAAAAEMKMIATATGYTDRAVRTAAEEMALAGFIMRTAGTPISYRAEPHSWSMVLKSHLSRGPSAQNSEIPAWRHWSTTFAFLLDVIQWAKSAEEQRWTDYVASSRARDLMETHESRVRHIGLDFAEHQGGRGADYLELFDDIVTRISARALANLYE